MRFLVLVLGFAMFAMACAPNGNLEQPRLEGVEWRAVTVAGRVPPAMHVPTLVIAGRRLTGNGGCNHYGANVQVLDGRLVADELGMTAMACLENDANLVEQAFIGILGAKPLIGFRGDRLVLAGPEGEVVFASAGATRPGG